MKRKISIIMSALALFSLVGCSGANGKDGVNGEDGVDGKDGISIVSIELTDTEGLEDTYTITYSDNSTSTFVVTNGADGAQGIQGEPGKDGHTPIVEINENGYWVIDGEVTEILAKGDKGDEGAPGKDGTSCFNDSGKPLVTLGSDGDSYIDTDTWDFYVKVEGVWIKKGNIKGENGSTPDINIGDNGNWFIDGVDTEVSSKGEDGKFIEKIEYNTSNGNVDIYTITFSDGTTIDFEITNKDTLEETFDITFDPNGGTLTSYFDESEYHGIKEGSIVELPTPLRAGYTFHGWYTSKTYAAGILTNSTPITQNYNLIAKWSSKNYPRLESERDLLCENIKNDLLKIIKAENISTEINQTLNFYLDKLAFAEVESDLKVLEEEVYAWLYSFDPDLSILEEKIQVMIDRVEPIKDIMEQYILEDYYSAIEDSLKPNLTSFESLKLHEKIKSVIDGVDQTLNNIDYSISEIVLDNFQATLDKVFSISNTIFSNLESSANPTGDNYLKEYKDNFDSLKEEFVSLGSNAYAYYVVTFKLRALFDEMSISLDDLLNDYEKLSLARKKINEICELEKQQLISEYRLDEANSSFLKIFDMGVENINSFFNSEEFFNQLFYFCLYYLCVPYNFNIKLNIVVESDLLFGSTEKYSIDTHFLKLTDITEIINPIREKGFDFDKFTIKNEDNEPVIGFISVEEEEKVYFRYEDFNYFTNEIDLSFSLKVRDEELAKNNLNDYFENVIVNEYKTQCEENGIDFSLLENEINNVKSTIQSLTVDDDCKEYFVALSKLKISFDMLVS